MGYGPPITHSWMHLMRTKSGQILVLDIGIGQQLKFAEQPKFKVCPIFVQMQGNQVVNGKMMTSKYCPEIVLQVFDELGQKC